MSCAPTTLVSCPIPMAAIISGTSAEGRKASGGSVTHACGSGRFIRTGENSSFLTPPVGFTIFFLQGVAPEGVVLLDIYKGVIGFVILQIIGLLLVFLWPELVLWLPSVAYS